MDGQRLIQENYFRFFAPAILFFSLLSLFSCSRGLVYHMQEVKKSYNGCTIERYECTYFLMRYPEIVKSPSAKLQEAVNAHVYEFLLHDEDYKGENINDLMKNFFRKYESFKKDFPDSMENWFVEKNVTVIYKSDSIVSLAKSELAHTGGAHPYSFVHYTNFDVKTGKIISLSDILTENYIHPLNDIAEKKFRNDKHLRPDDNFENSGYWFKNNQFHINDNFTVTNSGLKFTYNSYEIAPYSMGPTELELSCEELMNILKKDSFLKKKTEYRPASPD